MIFMESVMPKIAKFTVSLCNIGVIENNFIAVTIIL